MEENTKSLMDAIRRASGNRSSSNYDTANNNTNHRSPHLPSVPVACLMYACNTSQSHGRVAVRRAALRVSGILLGKSKECRGAVFGMKNKILLEWMTSVVDAPTFQWTKNNTNPNKTATQALLLQKETLAWMTFFCDHFAVFYPKLKAARMFLQQRCVALPEADCYGGASNGEAVQVSSGSNNMVLLRCLRDAALQHGTTECQRVGRLVQRAHTCLRTLVPRFGETPPYNAGSAATKDKNGGEEEGEEEEDDIDWEDGDGEDGIQEENVDNRTLPRGESHADAVDRTLSVMGSTGGFLMGGDVEIDFDEQMNNTDEMQEKPNEKDLQRLTKCINLLSSRHMPRLKAWVDALTRADSLCPSRPNDSSSPLVLLPIDLAQKRGSTLEALLDSKLRVASVLSSATRLGLSISSNVSDSANMLEQQAIPQAATSMPARHSMPTAAKIESRTRNIGSLSSQVKGHSVVRPKPKRVIQIKYRTSCP